MDGNHGGGIFDGFGFPGDDSAAEGTSRRCSGAGRSFYPAVLPGDEQKAKIQAQARTSEQMLRLNKVLIQADSINERVKELKLAPGGANYLYQSLADLRKSSPIALMSALKELAMNKEDCVYSRNAHLWAKLEIMGWDS